MNMTVVNGLSNKRWLSSKKNSKKVSNLWKNGIRLKCWGNFKIQTVWKKWLPQKWVDFYLKQFRGEKKRYRIRVSIDFDAGNFSRL